MYFEQKQIKNNKVFSRLFINTISTSKAIKQSSTNKAENTI